MIRNYLILIVLILIVSKNLFSQEARAKHSAGLDFGYTINNQLNLEWNFILRSKYYFSFAYGFSIGKYPKGAEITETDGLLDQIEARLITVGEGTTYTRYQVGFGRFFGKYILLKANVGLFSQEDFTNYKHPFGGKEFFIIKEDKLKPDASFGIRLFPVRFLSIGADIGTSTAFSGNVGFHIPF